MMRENGHKQGTVVPLPHPDKTAEIESICSSYCHFGGATVSTKGIQFPSSRNIYQLQRAGSFCYLYFNSF